MLAVVVASFVSLAEPACQLAVFDLEAGDGVTQKRAEALGEVVTAAVAEALPECHVIARAELRAIVDVETERQLGGCDSSSCLSEVGAALGVSRAVMGTASVVDGSLVLTLRLVDLEKARVEARQNDATRGDAVELTRYLAKRLIIGDDVDLVRPAEPPAEEAEASLWRTMAWTGVGVGGGLLALSAALGGTALGLSALSTSLKTTRGTPARDVDAVDAAGPWVAGGSNLALYVGAGTLLVGGALFFAPAEEEAAP